MPRSVQLPAPSRGAYDRSLSRVERDTQHRERLFLAAAVVSEAGTPTVARIVEHAGVGRSTFYEFFDSPEHLLGQLEQRIERNMAAALETALTEARTPLERIRAIARHFVAQVEARPAEARFALAHRRVAQAQSTAGAALLRALAQVAQASRADAVGWFRATDDVSLLAATAAVEALARRHTSEPIRDVAKLMADLVIKLLR